MIIAGDFTQHRIDGAHVMITDPPYRSHVHKKAVSCGPTKGAHERDLGFSHLTPRLRMQTAALVAKVERWSVIYSDVESLSWWRISCQAAGANYIRAVPWVRWSMPQLSGDRPPTGCEMVSVFHGSRKGAKHWNGPGNLTHLDHKCLRGEGKHKTEKPLDQALALVEWFSDPGEIVLDPFVGSGTTGVACALLGREFIGFEIDPEWAARGQERERQARQGNLSERDEERYARYVEQKKVHDADKARLATHTAKVRARRGEPAGAIPPSWGMLRVL